MRNDPKSFPWGAVLPVGALGALLGWIAVSYAIEDQRTDGAWYHSLPLLLLAAIPLGFVGFVLFTWLFHPAPQVWVAWYVNGVLRHVDGRGTWAYRWDEIASVTRHDVKVTNGVTSATTRRLIIKPEQDAEFVVGEEFSDMVHFADGLGSAFSHARVQRDAARLAAGERIDFGLVDIDTSGVGHAGNRIGWQEVERVDVKLGRVAIRRRGDRKPWLTLAAPGFPNLSVFLTLADELRRRRDS
ncbi:DUF6585 family protein [Streptomyces sp. NPDC098789]|uniref:DUF6585 family protein n=1 Tax=Streptomyces sp. NPDC098789 TaxID=3366098 RepID=UPI00382A85B6